MNDTTMLLAYLDPGTGSLVIQVLIAVVVSASFFLRHYVGGGIVWLYRKIKSLFVRPRQPEAS